MKLDEDILTPEEAQAMDAVGVAYIEHCMGDWYQLHVLVQEFGVANRTLKVRCSFTPFSAKDPGACADWLYSRWPSVKIVMKEEFDDAFWGPEGRPSGKLFAQRSGSQARQIQAQRALRHSSGTGAEHSGDSRVSSPRPYVPPSRPSVRAVPVPDSVTDDSWIPAVQAAHYLGIPPQYMYQRIKSGRVKTQGERPKCVRWGDVKRG